MHGRIYEIRTQRLNNELWMNETDLYDEVDGSWCDYVADSDDRKDDLEWLKSALPKSIFKVEGDVVEVISDGREFVDEWIDDLKKEVNALSYDKFTDLMDVCHIKMKMNNMIGFDMMFKTDYSDYPHNPTSFIKDCINQYQGKKLYVCGIVDYHF